MKLTSIVQSKVIYLTDVTRPAGQVFIPTAAQAFRERYHFQLGPTAQDLEKGILPFKIGLFEGAAIAEFSIHTDGVIVSSASDTTLLDSFLDDVMAWAKADLGLVQTGVPPEERHYESNVVIRLNLPAALPAIFGKIGDALGAKQKSYGLRNASLEVANITWAADATQVTGRGPIPFSIARRANVPFSEDVYFSSAPLKTQHHLELLKDIERWLKTQ